MVEEIYRENPDLPGFLLCDHGLVAVGKDAINAEHIQQIIEENRASGDFKSGIV